MTRDWQPACAGPAASLSLELNRLGVYCRLPGPQWPRLPGPPQWPRARPQPTPRPGLAQCASKRPEHHNECPSPGPGPAAGPAAEMAAAVGRSGTVTGTVTRRRWPSGARARPQRLRLGWPGVAPRLSLYSTRPFKFPYSGGMLWDLISLQIQLFWTSWLNLI